MIDGTRAVFRHGCNYAWSADETTVYYGMDFGANVWGSHLGVSTRRAAVAGDFAAMAALGFVIVRWFLFADGRGGIVYDGRGLPSGPDPHLFDDVDAALEIARDAGIQVDFVLLDHRWMFEGLRDTIADPITGTLLEASLPEGRSRTLLETGGREALFTRVIAPLVRRYGHDGPRADLAGQVFAWELMNEPDFVIEEWEQDVSRHVRRPLPFEALAQLVAALAGVVHRHTPAAATLGCARLHNLWAWDDDRLGLDVLQIHTYPDTRHPRREVHLVERPAGSLGVRRPVILGEFPGNGPERHPRGASPPATSVDEYLELALANGYAGAWPWSFSGTDEYGPLPAPPFRRFAARHPGLVNPRADAALTGEPSKG